MTGMTNLVQVILMTTIPVAVLGILGNSLVRTIHWKDMLMMIGVTLLPATVVLAIRGVIHPVVVMGVIGILTGHTVAFMDSD